MREYFNDGEPMNNDDTWIELLFKNSDGVCVIPFVEEWRQDIGAYWYITLKKDKTPLREKDLLYYRDVGYNRHTLSTNRSGFSLKGDQKLNITDEESARSILISFLKKQPVGKYKKWIEEKINNNDLLKLVGKFVFVTKQQRFGWMFGFNLTRINGWCAREIDAICFSIDAETGEVYENCGGIKGGALEMPLSVGDDPEIYFQKSNG